MRPVTYGFGTSMKVTVAQLAVRYLLEEAPRHKSRDILGYFFEGLLADSGPTGERLLRDDREERVRRGMPLRPATFPGELGGQRGRVMYRRILFMNLFSFLFMLVAPA